jgi:cytochrome b6-f complex iron-sulfur subunit
MAEDTKPDGSARGETEPALAGVAPSAPADGAKPAVIPPAGATGVSTETPPPPAAAAKPAASAAPRPAPPPRPPAAPIPDLAGKTTSAASAGGAAAKAAVAAGAKPAAAAKTRDADDTSPLVTRRVWLGLAWGAFSAASAAALAATGRFMFPNVLNEPPQQFKAGFPNEYGQGVDERWKEKFGVWLVRVPDDLAAHASGFYALLTTCTHLGCTPNYLLAESKFKCPCHGSGFRTTGINFEGPAPRPLERARIVLADDGQILVDKSRKFQYELGQWADPEAFLKA